MKTSIKTLFATALTLVVLSTSAFAATDVKNNNVTVLIQIKNITKIEVKGNVEVTLVQAPVESVKVYDSYYAKNALVQQQDGVLRISSFQKETLAVVVYVRDLSAIEASDNTQIKTYGKINFLSLDVKLNGNAIADINASTVSLTSAVKDNASLKLAGSTTDYYAVLSANAKLNMGCFVADNSSVKSAATVIAKAKPVTQDLSKLVMEAEELAK